MDQSQLTWIANFIWGIADDVLRDVFVRGKYRDVILPMTVLRRLDAVLEPTKQTVLETKLMLDGAAMVKAEPAPEGEQIWENVFAETDHVGKDATKAPHDNKKWRTTGGSFPTHKPPTERPPARKNGN